MNQAQYDIVKTFLPFGGAVKLAHGFSIPLDTVRHVERSNNFKEFQEVPRAGAEDLFNNLFGGHL